MHPLQNPLDNPRHEAFAFALAAGSPPEQAYIEAGFNPKNRKARAQPLADDPVIAARVQFLEVYRDEHGDGPAMWRADHCPEFFNKPYDRDHLIHWVWQIMKGTRVVTPIQWQATRFYARLCRWDIPGIQGRDQPNDLPLADCHRETLARLDAVQAARASQLHQTGAAIATDDDLSEFEAATESLPTDPDASVEYPWMWRQATLNPTAADSPEATAMEADQVTENPHLWQNVDLNPHAQITDNQPLNPENPHLCQKSSESTFSSHAPKTTSSEEPLPAHASAVRTSSLASKALATEAAAKNPNTPDPLPAPFPPLPECWQPEELFPEQVEWIATVMGSQAPDWVRSQYPAAAAGPRPSPLPLPPYDAEDYAPEELEWIIAALGQDATGWLPSPTCPRKCLPLREYDEGEASRAIGPPEAM